MTSTYVPPHDNQPQAVAEPPPPPPRTAPAVSTVPVERLETRGEVQRRELRRLRGFNPGAALFGWLIVVGIAVLLSSLLAATGAAIGLTQTSVIQNGQALSITGAVLLGVVLLLAYYAGGYVAGRLSRFAGAVQGFGVWLIGLLITVVLGIAGAIAGSKYNVLSQLRLPAIPVSGQSFVSGAVLTVIAITVATLLAAVLGGTVGLRYHHRVDRALDRT